MPYDDELDARVSDIVSSWGTERKKMFGGTGYLLAGNMMAGVWHEDLVLRLGEEAGTAALAEPHAKPFDVTGRPMKGWVMVEPAGVEGDALRSWLERARDFAVTLPSK